MGLEDRFVHQIIIGQLRDAYDAIHQSAEQERGELRARFNGIILGLLMAFSAKEVEQWVIAAQEQ
jgi:hypothetical protein